MRNRLAVGLLALVLATTATVWPAVVEVASAVTSCTGWKNGYQPPKTIRVYRTYGSAAGKVQIVDFRKYVENVMAWEWRSKLTYATASLQAGAIAVKQYGWYYAMRYRGGTSASGACYDVKDTAADQIYRPETRAASATERAVVAATWRMSIRRSRSGLAGQFILTGYRPGTVYACGAETDGFRLYQRGVYDCGRKHKTLEQILRTYYGSTLEITDPGDHQVSGALTGDPSAIVPTESGVNAFVHLSTGAAFIAPSAPDQIAIGDDVTLGRTSADLDGDGAEEMIVLVRDGDTAQHVAILKPSGAGYGDPTTWWDATTAGVAFPSERDGKQAIQLVSGDFDGDLVEDVGLVAGTEDPSQSTLYTLISTKTAFRPIATWWSGELPVANSMTYAADVTGDGRADLVAEVDGGEEGLGYWVSTSKAGGLNEGRTQWHDGSALRRATTQTVVTDWNRDGRDDLALAIATDTGFSFRGLRATGATFTPSTLYSSTLAFDRIKLAAGDVNGDGRGDAIIYTRLGDSSFGALLLVYRSDGKAFRGANWLQDLTLDWQTIEPY